MLLSVFIAIGLYLTSNLTFGQPCRLPCNAPHCSCPRYSYPMNLRDIPQMVYFGFDDAVNVVMASFYDRIFTEKRRNPNGCRIKMSLFISHQYTDYTKVKQYYEQGHEIAVHSVTHTSIDNDKVLLSEAKEQREKLAHLAGVPIKEIVGWRSPFLKTAGNMQPSILKELGYEYDISLTYTRESMDTPKPWPFTMDNGWPYQCAVDPCPIEARVSNFWAVPVVSLFDHKNQYPCAYVDGCVIAALNEEQAFNYLWNNFMSYYNTTRTPFGLNMHAAWFYINYNIEAMMRFLDELQKLEDVYVVTVKQMIDWMRTPFALSHIGRLQSWNCQQEHVPSNVHEWPSPLTSVQPFNVTVPGKLNVPVSTIRIKDNLSHSVENMFFTQPLEPEKTDTTIAFNIVEAQKLITQSSAIIPTINEKSSTTPYRTLSSIILTSAKSSNSSKTLLATEGLLSLLTTEGPSGHTTTTVLTTDETSNVHSTILLTTKAAFSLPTTTTLYVSSTNTVQVQTTATYASAVSFTTTSDNTNTLSNTTSADATNILTTQKLPLAPAHPTKLNNEMNTHGYTKENNNQQHSVNLWNNTFPSTFVNVITSKPVPPVFDDISVSQVLSYNTTWWLPWWNTHTTQNTGNHCTQGINCNLPNCYCQGTRIPNNLKLKDTPQMVYITIDGSIDYPVLKRYREFVIKKTNPNGCFIRDTIFTTTTRGSLSLMMLRAVSMGAEIAMQGTLEHHFQDAKQMEQVIVSQLETLKTNNISHISGWKTPELKSLGNEQYSLLKKYGFKYDATLSENASKGTSHSPWPYTLDFGYKGNCVIPECPTDSFPGLWEMPMIAVKDYRNMYECSYIDGCMLNPPTVEDTTKFLEDNFMFYYNTNRAPFGIHLRQMWFSHPAYSNNILGLTKFIENILTLKDVYFVSADDIITWIQNPVPVNEITNVRPWNCSLKKN